jgi:small subunit ribosomal protein S21
MSLLSVWSDYSSAECVWSGRGFLLVFGTLFPDGEEVSSVAIVVLRSNESQDQLLKRFRKKVVKSGILSTVRRKRWYVSKSELRRMEKKKAARRVKRRQYRDVE